MSNGHMAHNVENSLHVIQKKKVHTHISAGREVQERGAKQVFFFFIFRGLAPHAGISSMALWQCIRDPLNPKGIYIIN